MNGPSERDRVEAPTDGAATANWSTTHVEAQERQAQTRPPHGREHLGPSARPVNRRSYGPGQHGQRRKGKISDFGLQLRAKQKLKGYYGDVTEKQFKSTYRPPTA